MYPRAELTKHLYKIASENGVNTCLTLSSVNAVSDRFNEILAVLPYVDFLFGNEEEVAQFAKNLNFEGDLPTVMK